MAHYKDDEDRRRYPTPYGELLSVTTFLDELAKPALVPWAASITAGFFKDHLDQIKSGVLELRNIDIDTLVKQAKAHHKLMKEQAMDTGSAVHKAIEDWYSFGGAPEDPEVARLMEEAVAIVNNKLHFIHEGSEQVVYHPRGYAGTLDMVGKAAPGMVKRWSKAIIDFKTGKAIYPGYKMQVAAYAQAWEHMHQGQVQYAIIIRIDKESGKPSETLIMKRKEWREQAKAFNKLVDFVLFKDSLKPKKEKKDERQKV